MIIFILVVIGTAVLAFTFGFKIATKMLIAALIMDGFDPDEIIEAINKLDYMKVKLDESGGLK